MFDKGLHPAEDTNPTVAVISCRVRDAGETRMLNQNPRARSFGGQFNANDSLDLGHPAFAPSVDNQFGDIDFAIFALDVEMLALGINTRRSP